jgi:hypothetical protein
MFVTQIITETVIGVNNGEFMGWDEKGKWSRVV